MGWLWNMRCLVCILHCSGLRVTADRTGQDRTGQWRPGTEDGMRMKNSQPGSRAVRCALWPLLLVTTTTTTTTTPTEPRASVLPPTCRPGRLAQTTNGIRLILESQSIRHLPRPPPHATSRPPPMAQGTRHNQGSLVCAAPEIDNLTLAALIGVGRPQARSPVCRAHQERADLCHSLTVPIPSPHFEYVIVAGAVVGPKGPDRRPSQVVPLLFYSRLPCSLSSYLHAAIVPPDTMHPIS
ncbi:uncharacterized protein J3D65DRAFT_603605 [Phyllosticta citribraziliensis]|uniref:Secreted protein n=1 Tax=Phyllosticta citribraziliensis TaxID=989973 RepID=A0ABR1LKR9_9PEZI